MTELEQLKAKRDDLNRRIEQLEQMEPIKRSVQKALRDLADGFDNGRTRLYCYNQNQDRSRYTYNQYGSVTERTEIELTHFDLGKVELRMENERRSFR